MPKNSDKNGSTKRPSAFWLATEIGRAVTENTMSFPFRKLMSSSKSGDGHPVLVLPGFLSGDGSTAPLRKYLNKIGYNALPWKLGRNLANIEHLDVLTDKVQKIQEEHNDKVSLIGWSLGGIFARQIAKKQPGSIRQLITMGSPFRGVNRANNVGWIYHHLVKRKTIDQVHPELMEEFPKPAPVPTTAIFSKEDGIVPWELCMEEDESYYRQNIQVRGSHLGLGVNHTVFKIIEDRLKYSEANWVPFVPNNKVEELFYYPSF